MLSDELLRWSFIKEENGNIYLWFWPIFIAQIFTVVVLLPIEWLAKKVFDFR